MKIVPLGVGGAFTKRFHHNNYVLDFGKEKVLIDAGTTLLSHGGYQGSLEAAGYSVTDITAIIITHNHSDHIGGLGELGQQCRWKFQHKPTLILSEAQAPGIVEFLRDDLTDTDGSFEFQEFFDVSVVPEGEEQGQLGRVGIGDTGYSIYFVKTHGMHMLSMLSYALVICKGDLTDRENPPEFVIFSGDLRLLRLSMLAEIAEDEGLKGILQDCQFLTQDAKMPHAHFDEICEYYPEEVHGRIYLMHYGDDIEQHIDKVESRGMNIVQQGVPLELI